MSARGKSKYQDSKAIDPSLAFDQKRLIAKYGVLARDPLLLAVRDALGAATRLPAGRMEEAQAEIASEMAKAFLKKDAGFFERIAKLIQGITDLTAHKNADPRLRILLEAHYLVWYMDRALPDRQTVWDVALELDPHFTNDKGKFSGYCKQLGLKFSKSMKVRSQSRHGNR